MAEPVHETAARRPVEAFDAAGCLRREREALTKRWLLGVIQRTPLDGVHALPTDRMAQEVPGLIDAIALQVERAASGGGRRPSGQLVRAASALGSRGPGDRYAPDRDAASLGSTMIGALALEAPPGDFAGYEGAVREVARAFCRVQAAVAERDARTAPATRSSPEPATTPLTDLLDARELRAEVERLLDTESREGRPFAVLVVEVDGLARLGDAHGPTSVDDVLAGIAAALRAAVGGTDMLGRLDGDEFGVLLPHQAAPAAAVLAERLRRRVETVGGPDGLPLSVSVGVVGCPEHAADAQRLLDLADSAMFEAKASGGGVAIGRPEADPRGLDRPDA